MESDYLSHRNSYELDDEDVGSVLHGYSKYSGAYNTIVHTYA